VALKAVLGAIEGLYAAALTSEAWPAAMERLIALVGGGHAILHAHSSDDAQAVMSAGLHQRDLDRFACAEAVFWSQPFSRVIPFGIVVGRDQIQSDREFMRSPFWNEIVRPADGFHSISLLQKGPAGQSLISVRRSARDGRFDPTAAATLQAMGPHIAAALNFHFLLGGAGRPSAAVTRILDGLDTGAILTDAAARPCHMNDQAARIALQRDGLALQVSGLAASTPAQTQTLRAAIAAVAANDAPAGRWLRLERSSGRAALVVTVLPAWRLGAVVHGGGTPQVAVFIRETDAPVVIDPQAVAEAFGLTPREAEIAALLAGGRDLPAIAMALALGLGTVRFHLKRVFDKTGARNQAALVALIRNVMDVRMRP
jgi:DNA-binding CsgD family transcriptional regulator